MKKKTKLDKNLDKWLKPVYINEDVWFYKNSKTFDFVVWAKIGKQRQCVTFRVSKRKLQSPPKH